MKPQQKVLGLRCATCSLRGDQGSQAGADCIPGDAERSSWPLIGLNSELISQKPQGREGTGPSPLWQRRPWVKGVRRLVAIAGMGSNKGHIPIGQAPKVPVSLVNSSPTHTQKSSDFAFLKIWIS